MVLMSYLSYMLAEVKWHSVLYELWKIMNLGQFFDVTVFFVN